jgi:hypothetical protein
MRRLIVAAALACSYTSAFALPTSVAKGLKLGTGCIGPVAKIAPQLGRCAIAAAKSRIWCQNGAIFDLDEASTPVPLARSLCGLPQIP